MSHSLGSETIATLRAGQGCQLSPKYSYRDSSERQTKRGSLLLLTGSPLTAPREDVR